MSTSDERRPHEALAHLHAAATELIAAARIVLDVAEDLVSESIKRVGEAGRPRPPAPPPPVEKIEVLRREDGAG